LVDSPHERTVSKEQLEKNMRCQTHGLYAHGMRNEIVVEGIVERENASHPELGVVLKRGGRKREQKQNE